MMKSERDKALNIVLNYAQAMVDDGRGGTILAEAVTTLREEKPND